MNEEEEGVVEVGPDDDPGTVDPVKQSRLRIPRALHDIRNVSVMLAFLVAALALFLAYQANQTAETAVNDLDNEIDRQNAIEEENDFAACIDRRDARQAVRDLVILATEGSSGLPLSLVPSFDDLPQSIKTYLLDLQELSQQGGGDNSQFRQEALARLPEIVCERPVSDG